MQTEWCRTCRARRPIADTDVDVRLEPSPRNVSIEQAFRWVAFECGHTQSDPLDRTVHPD